MFSGPCCRRNPRLVLQVHRLFGFTHTQKCTHFIGYRQRYTHMHANKYQDLRTSCTHALKQRGCVLPPTLQCPNSSRVYSKGCYDTRGQWVSRAREGAGAVKLSSTLQSGLLGCVTAPISPRQCLTQAADRRLFRCSTAVNEA